MVSLLFSDVVGSTSLGELLDPEEIDEVVGGAQEALSATVQQYGGHVIKLLGDGLLACFGAPVAREDDAERAILAGLQMQAAIAALDVAMPRGADPLRLRVGITSGEVVAGLMGGSYDVTGDTANTAARLQAHADVGGVLVDEETMRAGRRRLRFGERRELELKGKTGTVGAYLVLGPRERVAERWEAHGERAPFVGREAELGTLLRHWEEARSGRGSVVSVIGEAGTGKSRLVAEALEHIQVDGSARTLHARCLSYTAEVSLWLVADLLRSLCDVYEVSEPAEIRTRLQETLASLLAGAGGDAYQIAVDVLGSILGLPPAESPVAQAGAEIRRRAMVRSLRLAFEALAVQAPTVLVLEDLHWIDAGSSEILSEVVTTLDTHPLLVVATRRPEEGLAWSAATSVATISLAPLPREAMSSLAQSILEGRSLHPELERALAERAEGNPFFLEELLRSLRDSGALLEEDGRLALRAGAAEHLPLTLTDVLMSRLDRLDADARWTAQIGSVIGRKFAIRVLAATVQRDEGALALPLRRLERAAIAYSEPEPEPSHVFRHATLWETAYSTLLLRRRKELHASAARALCRLYAGNEPVETIAHHFSRTDEHAESAEWLERAGDRAAAVFSNADAIARYEEARDRAQRAGLGALTLAALNEKRGTILRIVGKYDEALEALESGAAAYRDAGETEGEWRSVAQIGHAHRLRATLDEGICRIRTVLDGLEGPNASPGLAAMYVSLARLLSYSDRFDEQLQMAEQASPIARSAGDSALLAEAEVSRGIALMFLDRTADEVLAVLEPAAQIAEGAGALEALGMILNNASVVYLATGKIDASRRYRERALQLAEQFGEPARNAEAKSAVAYLAFLQGEWDSAHAYLDRALDLIRRHGETPLSAFPWIWTARLRLAEGDHTGAVDAWTRARRMAESIRDVWILRYVRRVEAEAALIGRAPNDALAAFEGMFEGSPLEARNVSFLLPTLAWALLANNRLDEAQATATEAVKRCREEPNLDDLPDALRIAGMVAAAAGRVDEARGHFEEALAVTKQMETPYSGARALYEYGRMLAQQGDAGGARERFQAALSIFERLGARPYIESTRAALEALATA